MGGTLARTSPSLTLAQARLDELTRPLEAGQSFVFAASGTVPTMPMLALEIDGLAGPIALPLTTQLARRIASVPSARRSYELGDRAPRDLPAPAVRIGNPRVKR